MFILLLKNYVSGEKIYSTNDNSRCMSVQKEQLQRINDAIWPSQDNSRSMYLFRAYTEKWDKNRGYIEIFRAYAVRKWSIQAHFAYALTLKPT